MQREPHTIHIRSTDSYGHFVTQRGDHLQDGGGQAYPFLMPFDAWEIQSRPLTDCAVSADGCYPSLRLVRSNRVVDIIVPTDETTQRQPDILGLTEPVAMRGLPTADFLEQVGLSLAPVINGTAVLSKRLSRIFAPYRYYSFYAADEVNIVHSNQLDPRVWDGIGLMSRDFLRRCTPHMLINVPDDRHEAYRRELETVERFEITIMDVNGQCKGDVIVVDDMPAHAGPAAETADFLFAAGSIKTDVRYTKGTFIGLRQPRHAKSRVRLDVQSLINLHGFLSNEQLLAWLRADSARFLDDVCTGSLDATLQNLLYTGSADSLAALRSWWLGDYFLSGGQALWFGGIVQALGRQRLRTLDLQLNGKLRFPIPAHRYYIAPSIVADRDVPRGHVTLCKRTASAFVNANDWLHDIVPVLGGCDGDDAVWCLPFIDVADDTLRLLIWRSPNQCGEYMLLSPTADSDGIAETALAPLPRLDSRLLPTRIDYVTDIEYGQLPHDVRVDLSAELNAQSLRELQALAKASGLRGYSRLRKAQLIRKLIQHRFAYTIASMNPAIDRAQANRGILGTYVNCLMLCRALFGRVPRRLPARLEDVIDSTVKDGRDLTPVRAWCEQVADQLARQQHAVPLALHQRIAGLTQHSLLISDDHWIDQLLTAAQAHLAIFQEDIDNLAAVACPPHELLQAGAAWLNEAQGVYDAWRNALGQHVGRADSVTSKSDRQAWFIAREQAAEATANALASWPKHQPELLAGLTTWLYVGGLEHAAADAILWQVGRDDDHNIADRFVEALRQLGLLGQPLWTEVGAVRYYEDVPEPTPAIPLMLRGTWFNWLRVQQPQHATMQSVPKALARRAKQQLQTLAPRFAGLTLTVHNEADRLIMHTPHNNLFGYVQRGQEALLTGLDRITLTHVQATRDGNIRAIALPA